MPAEDRHRLKECGVKLLSRVGVVGLVKIAGADDGAAERGDGNPGQNGRLELGVRRRVARRHVRAASRQRVGDGLLQADERAGREPPDGGKRPGLIAASNVAAFGRP
jgi:hypothetical protein